MALIDKFRDLHAQPADGDLLAYLGVRPDEFRLSREGVTVAGETISVAEARLAMAGGPIPTAAPTRSVRIGDLPNG